MSVSNDEWDLIILEEIDSINTQAVWHAAALARSRGIQQKDLLIIDWPSYPIVSCGLHQSLNQVVDLDYCSKNNVPVIRRACGGGTVLLDSNQLFYHTVSHIDSKIIPRKISSFYSKVLEPVVQTYRHFNIDAVYRPVNDVMVENRKISGNGAGLFEQAQVLVGNFILDFPRKEMTKIFRVPNEKFRDKVYKSLETGISSFKDEIGYIPDRKAIIKEYIGQCEELLGVGFTTTSLNPKTNELLDKLRKKYLTDTWLYQVNNRGKDLHHKIKIHGSTHVVEDAYKSPGGLIQVICEFRDSILVDILISGDFWIFPDTILPQLEQHLRNTNIETINLPAHIESFLQGNQCQSPGTSASDFIIL
jgi:lipoate-protein ligase A